MNLAELLRKHWPEYVAHAGGAGKIPTPHWRAVEAVLACRTPRLGGHVHACTDCGREHYLYHSCNHRACPRCGQRERQLWAARQQSRRLPVPYFMLTFTVPAQMHGFFRRYERVAYRTLFAAASAAIKELAADPKYLGGGAGFIAVLHTWTRQMAFHPHVHVLIPAAGLSEDGCHVRLPDNPEYLFPHARLAERYRKRFLLHLSDRHPGLLEALDPAVHTMPWNVNVRRAGRGKSALRYLAAYVNRSAFSEERLLGYDGQGNIRMAWRDSSDGKRKLMSLRPVEFIRRWLQHVLPKGFTRLRHYGFLSAAAAQSFVRLRFLLGGRPLAVELPEERPPCCPHCEGTLEHLRKIQPVRGPPQSIGLLRAR